jgi:hypothetical protein
LHHPSGEIVPSTDLQEDGGSNNLQFEHFWSPCGVSWYETAVFAIFAHAKSTLMARTGTDPTAATLHSSRRREIPADPILIDSLNRASFILTLMESNINAGCPTLI